jgi:2-amino-4-hydroxy-6-hydroxymethyldihydropteridine diphosphokinase
MRVLIGLGGNLGEPRRAFARALAGLAERGRVVAVSGLFASRAIGPPQPDYFNSAAMLEVADPLGGLLARCAALEAAAGRLRDAERWGPRTLDLDLLMAGGFVFRGPDLTLPHPRFHERGFALVPAAEIAAAWVHPLFGRTVAELAAAAAAADPAAVTPLGAWR